LPQRSALSYKNAKAGGKIFPLGQAIQLNYLFMLLNYCNYFAEGLPFFCYNIREGRFSSAASPKYFFG
jgi:hypothetical protein